MAIAQFILGRYFVLLGKDMQKLNKPDRSGADFLSAETDSGTTITKMH
nr:hypothetical protein [Pedobacter sp. ASV2]